MSSAIHGDKQQNERDWVLNEFKTGKSPIMVATDVASRGIGMLDRADFSAQPSPFHLFWSLCQVAYDAVLASSWFFPLAWLGIGSFSVLPLPCRVLGYPLQPSIIWSLASSLLFSKDHFRPMRIR